jgi:hypothetical protein
MIKELEGYGAVKRISRALLLPVFAVLFVVPIVGVVGLGMLVTLRDVGRYDNDNSDYRYVTSRVIPTAVQVPGLVTWQRNTIDLRSINGGDWQFICVIGAYNDPIDVLRKEANRRALTLTTVDSVSTKFLGLSPVEEGEGAISFVDRAGRGRTVLINGFERLAWQSDKECYGPETGEILLPISGTSGDPNR